jgi:hypothetical protein
MLISCQDSSKDQNLQKVRGWNILAHHKQNAIKALNHAEEYNINHLQLSHKIIMDLKDVRDSARLSLCRNLIQRAHEKGIEEVTVWDHQLYNLDYYPDRFKTQEGKINLDNPNFWKWVKADYRSMLDSLPNIDGIILTFIETGAHVEDQHSEIMKKEEEKLAALVDTLSKVIIDERNLNLYVRTFAYSMAELKSTLNCIDLIEHPEVRVMTKEVPHDFFLTHPVSWYVKDINKPVLIEFDATHEYHGQGILASIFPQVHMKRLKYYLQFDNVVGYVARTDRYGNTQIIGRPSEINLYALKNVMEDTTLKPETIFEEFIAKHYGEEAIPSIMPAFKNAYDIFTSVYYTLGIHNNSHSRLDYYQSSYSRHVSGKWTDSPYTYVKHGVNKKFHYWKDVVNHLSPPEYKRSEGTTLAEEVPSVIDSGWVQPKELINRKYLDYLITEKDYGVKLAHESLQKIREAEDMVHDSASYAKLLQTYERTYLTSQLYRGVTKAHFGYRLYCRGEKYRSDELVGIIKEGLEEINEISSEIRNYPHKGPSGQYSWEGDAHRAMEYYKEIAFEGKSGCPGILQTDSKFEE